MYIQFQPFKFKLDNVKINVVKEIDVETDVKLEEPGGRPVMSRTDYPKEMAKPLLPLREAMEQTGDHTAVQAITDLISKAEMKHPMVSINTALATISSTRPVTVGTCFQIRKASPPYRLNAAIECPLGKL
ncbi:hypothetical protein ACS72_00125 [Acinetobacter sp. VT 511]|nr:hypothetical protein ACS72_00125 [Acinetobacter sp. VT 511]